MKNKTIQQSLLLASLSLLSMTGVVQAANDLYWDINQITANSGTTAAGNWDGVAVNWNDDPAGGAGGTTTTALTSNINDLHFSSGTGFTGASAIAVSGVQSANSLIFEEGSVTLSGGTSITLGGGGGTNPGLIFNNGTGADVISTALILGANSFFTNSDNTGQTVSGGITGTGNLTIQNNSTGTMALSTTSVNHVGTVTNSGTGGGATTISIAIGSNVTGVVQNSTTSGLTLSAANSYTGGTSVLAGTVTATNAGAFGSGTITVGDSSGALNSGVTLGAVGANVTNAILIQGGNTGTATLNAGSTSGRNFTGTITLSGHNVSLSGGNVGGFTGKITGTGGVVITPSSNITYFGNNTSDYSGGTTINTGGTLSFGTGVNGSVFGTGTVIINGLNVNQQSAAATITGANNQIWNVDWGTSGGGSGALNLNMTGTIDLGAANSGGSTGNTTRTLTIAQSSTSVAGILQDGSNGLTKGITKAGANQLTLSGLNTYTGATNVNAGALRAGSTQAFGVNSAVTTLNIASAVLNLNGFNNSIGSLAGGGATGGNVTLGAGNLTTGGNNASTSYGGVISGTGGLVKTGSGTQTLTGVNTYTGATSVNGGTLLINGSLAAASAVSVSTNGVLALGSGGTVGAVAVNATGTLNLGATGATGSAGAVTVAATGTLAGVGTVASANISGNLNPGNSPGTITVADGGALVLNSSAISSFEFTNTAFTLGSFDLVQRTAGGASESLTLDGILNLNFSGGVYSAGTNLAQIFVFDSYSGNFNTVNFSGLDPGLQAVFNNSTGFVSIVAVPEPSTYALLGLGLGALWMLRRKKRASDV